MRNGSRSDSLNGFMLRFLDRINHAVTASTALVLLYTRSVGVGYFCAGAMACMVSVKLIKPILRQARPVQTTPLRQKETYGMPSTHSTAITYFGTYIPLACAWLPLHESLPESPLLRPFVALFMILLACTVAGSRILLGHHTVPQVIVGCIYGFTFACIWFGLWTHGLSDWGEIVEYYVREYI